VTVSVIRVRQKNHTTKKFIDQSQIIFVSNNL